ncbi:MAG: leucine--tRNA ligase [Candidatus Poseidoniales archaeon]|jgi:leucyl-tRNA synthetase|tara:strand:- start:191 stop:3007 length:2817 start_codon:yes stop_codon:yes gene_type:complete
MSEYIPQLTEESWQKAWDDANIFHAKLQEGNPTFYCLEMYPYPSGKMHMGHVRNYSIGDAVARYKRLMGFDVLYPMGFDSFGMPAENAAIAEGGHPHDITERNMASITQQIKRMGFSYDWRRLVKSHDPQYYRWNQWFFLKFVESGLAYRKYAPVNWCNSCNTVLANEQVKAGRCWRCNGPVIQKEMSQWFLDITKYAQELLDGLETIDFPENVKALQQDWIGRSEGAEIEFGVEGRDDKFSVFTTRPDTLFGVTFVTLAPEHELAHSLVEGTEYEHDWKLLHDEVVAMSEFDRIKNMGKKKGVPTGSFAIHPLTGECVPIWIGNFIIASYGTGAVMAVPGHDERDFEFANKYDLPIKRVLMMTEQGSADDALEAAECGLGWMVNSGIAGFDGLYGSEAKAAVCDTLEKMGTGNGTINWKIRPWLISRQRYWGTPIPIIHCEACGAVPVPVEQLPVELPRDVVFDGKGNPLESSSTFCDVDCPTCGNPARRETDTMDTFVDSSWYFLRYTDSMQNETCFNPSVANHWMNVDFYCGGIEHAQMHLIYARFWTKALRDMGLHDIDEPFNELLCQGMVNKTAPWCDSCAITLNVSHSGNNCPQCDSELGERSAKMSKSLGNTVSPEDMIEKYGADTVRLFILFAANPTAGMDWSDSALEANYRQMVQLYSMPEIILSWNGDSSDIDLWMRARLKQRCIQWQDSMDSYDLRGAVDASHFDLIKDINWYRRRGGENPGVGREILEVWTHMISIATPHIAEDWWKILGHSDLVAGRVFDTPGDLGVEELAALDAESYLRAFLEQARKVAKVASKHIGGNPSNAIVHISRPWRRELAQAAISHLESGENVKTFAASLATLPFAQGEMRGEVMGFWGKRMLPQIFKWSDDEKRMIVGSLDEGAIISAASGFICRELGISSIDIETGDIDIGRSGTAIPLAPSVIYS